MINLKNYTSTIDAHLSMSRIEQYLVKAGATDISKKYDQGVCRAITFRMLINNEPLFFQLPAKVDLCFNVLWKQIKKPQDGTKEKIMIQAQRTAWKIVSDWVEIQLSMILLEQAEPMQVFLPYAYDPASDETFYDKMKKSGFKALLGPAK